MLTLNGMCMYVPYMIAGYKYSRYDFYPHCFVYVSYRDANTVVWFNAHLISYACISYRDTSTGMWFIAQLNWYVYVSYRDTTKMAILILI